MGTGWAKATKISDEAISSWYRARRGFTWLQMMRKKRNVSILGKKVYFFSESKKEILEWSSVG